MSDHHDAHDRPLELASAVPQSLMTERRSFDQGASATPTLHDEPLDEPLPEKGSKILNADADLEDAPQVGSASAVDPESNGGDDGDVLIVDWDGPDDPHNPRK